MERLDRVKQEAEKLTDREGRVSALSGVARALLKAGDRDAAVKVIKVAGASLEWVGLERLKSEALAAIIPTLVQVEDEQTILAIKKRAATLAEAIPSKVMRCAVMKEMAGALIARGDASSAGAVARQCLACARAIDYETDRIEASTALYRLSAW
jgi:hypothetical protein